MSEISPAVAAPPQEKPSNSFSRMVGVIFSPGQTFDDIARKPDWVIPSLVIVVVVFIATFLTVPRIDFDATYREVFEAKGMSGQQLEQAMKFSIAIAKGSLYFAPFWLLGGLAVGALIYFLGVRMLGGAATYTQVFSVVIYGFMPNVIRTLLRIPIVLTKHNLRLQEIDAIVRSSPAFLINLKDHPVLYALASRFDLFALWSVVLIAIGLAAASKLSKAKAAAIVIVVWVIMTLFTVGGAAMGAMKR